MKRVRYSTKAKRDLKRYRNDISKMRMLYMALDFLVKGLDLPEQYRAHELIGNYKGCMECHVGSDFLLIWIDEKQDVIEILRLGSHSELF